MSGRCVGVFTVDKPLRLRGPAWSTVLDGAGQGTTLTIGENADVTVIGLTITGGSGTAVGPAPSTLIGGGVVVHGRLTLRDWTVTNNSASESSVATVDTGQGAGIWNDGWLGLDGVTVSATRPEPSSTRVAGCGTAAMPNSTTR